MRLVFEKRWPVLCDFNSATASLRVEQDDEGRYWLKTDLGGDGRCVSQLAGQPTSEPGDGFLGSDLNCGYVPGSGYEELERELAEELGTCLVEGSFRFN